MCGRVGRRAGVRAWCVCVCVSRSLWMHGRGSSEELEEVVACRCARSWARYGLTARRCCSQPPCPTRWSGSCATLSPPPYASLWGSSGLQMKTSARCIAHACAGFKSVDRRSLYLASRSRGVHEVVRLRACEGQHLQLPTIEHVGLHQLSVAICSPFGSLFLSRSCSLAVMSRHVGINAVLNVVVMLGLPDVIPASPRFMQACTPVQ